MKQATPTEPKLPMPVAIKDAVSASYLTALVKAVLIALRGKMDRNVPVDSILLASPNGSVYSVRVTDAGVVETDLVYDGS